METILSVMPFLLMGVACALPFALAYVYYQVLFHRIDEEREEIDEYDE